MSWVFAGTEARLLMRVEGLDRNRPAVASTTSHQPTAGRCSILTPAKQRPLPATRGALHIEHGGTAHTNAPYARRNGDGQAFMGRIRAPASHQTRLRVVYATPPRNSALQRRSLRHTLAGICSVGQCAFVLVQDESARNSRSMPHA